MKINELVKYHRNKNNWTLTELSKKLGLAQSTISYWERNISTPSIYYMEKLKEIFGSEFASGLEGSDIVEEPTEVYRKADDGIGALYRSMEQLVQTNAELVKMLQEQMGKK